jgi:hypothetical protein
MFHCLFIFATSCKGTVQGVPKNQNYSNNVLLEFECLSTPLNPVPRLSKVRGSWFLEATDFCHPQARQIHRCIFAPVTSVNAHYYSVLTTPFDMVNAHYVIIDFRAKFFIKIQNQASDTSRSLPSFSSAPFLLRAVPSERLGQVYPVPKA